MNLSKEPIWEINLTSHHYKQATKRQMNDHLSTAVNNSIKEKSIPFDWINSNLWNWFSILKWWNEFFFETIPSSTIECLFWRTIQELFLSWNVVNPTSSFVHRSYLFHTIPFLESWRPVCFLTGESSLVDWTRAGNSGSFCVYCTC